MVKMQGPTKPETITVKAIVDSFMRHKDKLLILFDSPTNRWAAVRLVRRRVFGRAQMLAIETGALGVLLATVTIANSSSTLLEVRALKDNALRLKALVAAGQVIENHLRRLNHSLFANIDMLSSLSKLMVEGPAKVLKGAAGLPSALDEHYGIVADIGVSIAVIMRQAEESLTAFDELAVLASVADIQRRAKDGAPYSLRMH